MSRKSEISRAKDSQERKKEEIPEGERDTLNDMKTQNMLKLSVKTEDRHPRVWRTNCGTKYSMVQVSINNKDD